MAINGWRVMWVLASYDCPTVEKEQRYHYTQFRKTLLQENFMQLQESLYAHHFPTFEVAQAAVARLRPMIPEGASCAFFYLTDKQFGMTHDYIGTKRKRKTKHNPDQIELF
ncbi:MAG: CRISPR-associated endonuclease Cas2 [Alphaproteobacteria bacterium]|nr:CRISPR-associated endonuclease Cas2 [Alphaproteobacteria bacterium]